MAFEVELKFRVADFESLLAKLLHHGARPQLPTTQRDRYFNHPSHDFSQTDEALRLRLDGGRPYITYKGPKIDAKTKTRREIEVPFGEGLDDLEKMSELLLHLGFRPVATVQKERRAFDLEVNNTLIEVSLDEVAGLGCFLELEGTAEADDIDRVRQVILEFADDLGLNSPERPS